MAITRPKPKTFPLWFQDGTKNVNYLDEFFRCAKNLPISSQNTNVNYSAALTLVGYDWGGGVLAANGSIYCAPLDSTSILKINTSNDSISYIGSFAGSYKYCGGILAQNGKIYFVPCSASVVLVLDPSNDSTYTFGSGSFAAGYSYRLGGVLDKTGRYIYSAPHYGTKIIKIDTYTDTVTELPYVGGGQLWGNGALAANGYIYFAPSHALNVLKLDTDTDTVTTFGTIPAGANKYYSAVTSKEGNVYLLSLIAGQTARKINISDDSITTIDLVYPTWGGCMGVDGKLYLPGYGYNQFVVLDTTNDSFQNYSKASATHIGAISATNGKIYMLPYGTTYVHIIGNTIQNIDSNLTLSRIFNKL